MVKEADTKDDNNDNRGSNPIHSVHTSQASGIQILQDQIQRLQKSYDALRSQVESLQQKIIQLESKLMTALRFGENPKYALSQPSQPLKSYKTIQQKNTNNQYPGRKKGPLFERK